MLKTTYRPSAPLPPGWTEHTAPSGHKYYYNAATKQSTYTRPQSTQATEQEELQIDYNATAPDASLHAKAQALDEFYRNPDPRKWQHSQNQKHGNTPTDGQPERSKRGHGGDRPKSKKLIPGAEPWVLVTTKFGRRFVHNLETKQSLWKFPQDVMMAVIELDRSEWEQKQRAKEQAAAEEAHREADERDPESAQGREAVKLTNAMQRGSEDEGSSSEYEEVEVTDDEGGEEEAGGKRPRLDEDTTQEHHGTGAIEMNEDDIEWQLAQLEAQDDYDDNDNNSDSYDNGDDDHDDHDDDGLALTAEDNVDLFRSLLDDFGISPYTTFDKITEDLNLVEDRRYLALSNMRARRDVFAEWSKERVLAINAAKAEAEAKASDNKDPTISYLAFLHQHATPKLYWPEFKRKHRKEAAMKNYELSDKDRERLYRELTSKLKLGEGERRKEVLALLKQHLGSSSKKDGGAIPHAIRKDVRYYILDARKRDEIVDDFFDML